MKKNKALVLLGHKIKELRTQQGYTQESFAEKTALHRTYIGCIERGEKNVTFLTANKIADALDITISELFKGV